MLLELGMAKPLMCYEWHNEGHAEFEQRLSGGVQKETDLLSVSESPWFNYPLRRLREEMRGVD